VTVAHVQPAPSDRRDHAGLDRCHPAGQGLHPPHHGVGIDHIGRLGAVIDERTDRRLRRSEQLLELGVRDR
jgi:hypothetical protein